MFKPSVIGVKVKEKMRFLCVILYIYNTYVQFLATKMLLSPFQTESKLKISETKISGSCAGL